MAPQNSPVWRQVTTLLSTQNVTAAEMFHFLRPYDAYIHNHKILAVSAIDSAIWKVLVSDLCRPSILPSFYSSTRGLKMGMSVISLQLPQC
jgi:hypothetical protein